MYDIIEELIGHAWVTGTGYNTTEQQYITSIAGVCIIIVLIVFARWIDKIFFR